MSFKKSAWICFFGICFSSMLIYMFTSIDFELIEKIDWTKEYSIEELQERARRMNWRSRYVYYPTIFALVGLFISVLDRSKHKMWLVVIGVLPLTLVVSPSVTVNFSLYNLSILFLYFAIASTVSYFVPAKEGTLASEVLEIEMKLIKILGICFLGIFLSFTLLIMFKSIDWDLIKVFELPTITTKNYPEKLHELEEGVRWRFKYVYYPAIFALVGLVISVLDRGKYKMLLVAIGLFPMAIIKLFNIDSLWSFFGVFFLIVFYFTIALAVSYLVPVKKDLT